MANYTSTFIAPTCNIYSVSTSTSGAWGASGSLLTTTGSNGTSWMSSPSYYTSNGTGGALQVSGDLNVDGKITVKGKDLVKLMETVETRLAILQDPDPEKLKKFEALKKAYDHYKLMEKLIGEE